VAVRKVHPVLLAILAVLAAEEFASDLNRAETSADHRLGQEGKALGNETVRFRCRFACWLCSSCLDMGMWRLQVLAILVDLPLWTIAYGLQELLLATVGCSNIMARKINDKSPSAGLQRFSLLVKRLFDHVCFEHV